MIKVENLTKKYGMLYAVNDITFSVSKGEIVGFLGPNGAGKSTTLNILTGYLSSTGGKVEINGHDITDDAASAKKSIGYLPEIPPLYGDMTVSEYMNFVYELKACTLNRKKHLEELYDVAKIGDVKHRLIKNLSKGYKQRLGIAQALVGNPPVIILDEPTIGLDPRQIVEIRSLIRALGRDHAVILSSHILSEVQSVCDRVLIIKNGKIIADQRTEDISSVSTDRRRHRAKICGASSDVMTCIKAVPGIKKVEALAEHELDSTTYVIESEEGIDIRKPLFSALAAKNYPLIGLESMGVSLEDVFLSLLGEKKESGKPARRTKRVQPGTKQIK